MDNFFNPNEATQSWIKTLESTGQQTIKILDKQKLIPRQTMDPTSFLIYPVASQIVCDGAPPKDTSLTEEDFSTVGEWGSVLYCYVAKKVRIHSTGWHLDLKAFLSRSRDFAPYPPKAMKTTKKLLADPQYLRDIAGARITEKDKKTKRGRNYRSRVRSIQEAMEDWASEFDSYSIHVNGEVFSEKTKKRGKTNVFIVIEPSHVFSDVFMSKRLWFIQTSLSYDSEGC